MLPIPQRLGINKEPALGVFYSPTSDLAESLRSSCSLSILSGGSGPWLHVARPTRTWILKAPIKSRNRKRRFSPG